MSQRVKIQEVGSCCIKKLGMSLLLGHREPSALENRISPAPQ